MKLLCNNTEVEHTEGMLEWDISKYAAQISFVTPFVYPDKDYKVKDINLEAELHLLQLGTTGSSPMIATFCSKEWWENQKKDFGPYYGQADLVTFLRSVGLSLGNNVQSQSVYWNLKKCKYTTLLDYCKNNTLLSNTYGMFFNTYLDGTLLCYDMESIYKGNKAVMIEGDILSSKATDDWILRTPGEVDVIYHDKDGISAKNLKILDGYGKGSVSCLVSDDNQKEAIERQVMNEFWYNYYQAWEVVIRVKSLVVPPPGSLVSVKGFPRSFICKAVKKLFNSSTTTEVQVTLCAPLR